MRTLSELEGWRERSAMGTLQKSDLKLTAEVYLQ